MAIISTGAIYKSLVFDGESSRDYGIYITGQAVYNAPERDVEMINIPGRNGSFALDKGRFQNIEVTYPAGIFADNETDFAQGVSDFRNFLCSRNGYVRLTDDYNPDEYRMAVYKSGLDVSPAQLKAGEFQLVFDCKPQRYLTSGEEPITIGEWHETETASGEIASFEAVEGDAVKSLVADIEPTQDLHGYDKPWSGGAGKNKLENTASTTTTNGITFTVNSDGTVTANGTATADAQLNITLDTSKLNGDLYFVGSNGSADSVANAYMWDATSRARCKKWDGTSASATSFNGTLQQVKVVQGNNVFMCLRVMNGKTVSNHKFIPMIVASSVSDATYEPYTNICPISGYDSVVVSRCGKNLAKLANGTRTGQGITGTVSNQVISASGTATATYANINYFNAISITSGQTYTVRLSKSVSNAITFRFATDNTDTTYQQVNIASGSTSATFTANNNFTVFRLYISSLTSGTVVDISGLEVLVGVGDVSAYEPYQGDTYTINLNGTRYGGTLDVASGVLTVDRAIVDLGDFTWSYFHSSSTEYFYSSALSDYKYIDSDTVNYLCSAYESISGNQERTNGTLRIGASKTISVQDLNYTSGSAFKTAVTGQTLCYELATPTTVQLTAQEVELLVGLNQVWANSGDVSVEYGTAPNVAYNPTLFESSPMLEVEGTGNIVIGEDTITVEDELIGEVPLTSGTKTTTSATLNTANLNSGDSIYTYASPRLEFKLVYGSGKIEAELTTISGGTGTNYTKSSGGVINIVLNISNLSFVYGTSASQSVTAGYRVILNNSTATTATFTFTATYNGSTGVTLSWNASGLPSGVTRKFVEWIHPVYYGNSSKSAVPMPLYIDLDIGEAWGELGGEMVNLNNIVSLPASLPKLAAGDTEITYSNTITDLKLIPRWWKI